MSRFTNPAKIQLPKAWSTRVRSAMLHVVSLAKYAAVYTRSWAADSPNVRLPWHGRSLPPEHPPAPDS